MTNEHGAVALGLGLHQHCGLWAMHPPALQGLLAILRRADTQQRPAGPLDRPSRFDSASDYSMLDGGIAAISLVGVLTKYSVWWSSSLGAVRLRRAVREAVADSRVNGILLRVDSPGGSTAGVGDLADDLYETSKLKPVRAYVEDLAASAAYHVAAQAPTVTCNSEATVGSIGTYGMIYDFSRAFDKMGIRAIVIRAGEMKGAGELGTEISAEQVAEFQRNIDETNEVTLRNIARGRGVSLERVRRWADGKVHVGKHAVGLGLVDALQTWDSAVASLQEEARDFEQRKGNWAGR